MTGTPISNSFNYASISAVAEVADLGDCPIRRGEIHPPPVDPIRGLMLHFGEQLISTRTRTSDFSPADIVQVRDELGQVYLDISSKLLLDDFRQDLAPLRRAPECAACPARPACPTAFAVTSLGSDLDANEAQIRSILARWEGAVLDVGVGEPHSLLPLLDGDSGTGHNLPFTYVGIEPDGDRFQRLTSTHPGLEVHRAAAEDQDLRAATGRQTFDHVMLLRSYNHLHDPKLAFASLVDILRPGGSMLVVDNTAFALVRSRTRLQKIEKLELGGGAVLEHHRNHTSHQAKELLAHLPLRLLSHRPVGPDTANQWLLHLEREA